MSDTKDTCEKCGGQMIIVLPSNPARSECKTCGHHIDFLWDPALPDDYYKQLDSTLTISQFQSVEERNRVAIELRGLLGISPTEAMQLVRALPINGGCPGIQRASRIDRIFPLGLCFRQFEHMST